MSQTKFIRDTRREKCPIGIRGWRLSGDGPLLDEMQYAEYLCGCGATFEAIRYRDQLPLCKKCEDEETARESREAQVADRADRTRKRIPPRFQWAEFGVGELEQRVRPPRVIASAMSAVGAPSVVLLGEAGYGKTTLACALLRAAAAKLKTVGWFYTTFDLAKARREQRLGHGEAEVIQDAASAPVLLIDELCAEDGRDTAVDEVIRARWDNMLPTIYTCGFSRETIKSKYGDGVARRVLEGATIIKLGGK